MLPVVFGFVECREKATLGSGCKLVLTRNGDALVFNKPPLTDESRIVVKSIDWFVPHYTPSMELQALVSQQVFGRTPMELQCVERSVFIKEVKTQNPLTYEIGSQAGNKMFLFGILWHSNKKISQNLNIDNSSSFYRPPISNAQCIIGTRKNPYAGIFLNYNDVYYSPGYGQFKEAFETRTKEDLLQPYQSDQVFRSSKNGVGGDCNSHAFDIRYQTNFTAANSIRKKIV